MHDHAHKFMPFRENTRPCSCTIISSIFELLHAATSAFGAAVLDSGSCSALQFSCSTRINDLLGTEDGCH